MFIMFLKGRKQDVYSSQQSKFSNMNSRQILDKEPVNLQWLRLHREKLLDTHPNLKCCLFFLKETL